MAAIRMRILSGLVLCTTILVWVVIAWAAMTQASSDSVPSWYEHVDLMQAVIAGLFLLALWFLVRTLTKIDANQSLLFKKVDELCKDFYTLRGEHDAIKARCDR
jgi:uncharacterized membrane protein YhdT